MSARLELFGWVALLVALSAGVAAEGRRRADLERRVPLGARELYGTLARSRTSWQVVDVRDDLAAGYEDAHVPGALPMPGCDLSRAPAAARDRILTSVPTAIVSEDGKGDEVRTCVARFTSARAVAGGMAAWSEARLPEDTGEYVPPSVKAGGGCL